jgi:AcrR family transcriptional regulator
MVFVSSPLREGIPDPPWAKRRTRDDGRPRLSRDAIVDAALGVLDDGGYEGLNMRRVADALGTGPASLYAHVSGKDEMFSLMIDRVAGEIEVPDPDPEHWQEQAKDFIRAIYRSFLAHPGLARANLGTIPTGPGAIAAMDRFLGILAAGGVPEQVKAYAADILPLYATAYAFEQSVFAERMTEEEAVEHARQIGEYFASLPAARFPHITAMADALTREDPSPDARFEFGLDLLVAGLAAQR